MSKIDHSLFDANLQGHQQAFGSCPSCEAPLQIRRSKNGAFIGCSRYPQCDFTKPLHEHEDSQIKIIEGSQCPECGGALAIKKGRYGLFIGCSHFPECHHIESTKSQDETRFDCPQCKRHQLVKRSNRFGKSFYACDGYPRCKFVLNSLPVAGQCEKCGFGLLTKKGQGDSAKRQCADKKCQHIQQN
ncbi:topoisomerase DNA-binding C4 zinc finger domain-containing protein [Neptunicella sp. SCSIO 80796]|uniref:DNA topoisomerase family protein n=1 Tax=Neptunicella plasticusilytica TaxID=3117012 RepID=UPI003A4D7427